MVSRFLVRVIERPWLFKRILIVTFTNKATEELKTRIIRELDRISSGQGSGMLADIRKALPALSDQEIQQRAGEVLGRILHDYSSFAVSTIDSFFQSLTRTLARELDIPFQFEIELDTDAICEQVTDLLLQEAGRNKDVLRWLQELLLHNLEDAGNWEIRKPIFQMTKQLLSNPEALSMAQSQQGDKLRDLIIWMKQYRAQIETFMRGKASEAIDSMQRHGYTIDDFHYKDKGPAGYFKKVASRSSNYKDFGADGTRLQAAYNDPLAFISKADQRDGGKVSFVQNVFHPLVEEMLNYYNDEKRNYLTILSALKLVYLAGISTSIEEKLREFRTHNHLFHLSDTTRLLSLAVKDQDAPFIYEKSGNTFSHIFIDEFQDTSTLQWEILRPLVINALSTNQEVLIVGDAKQAIYRWRGGNMNLILEGVEKDLAPHGIKAEKKNLGTNYRSWSGIVECNNALFPLLADYFKTLSTAESHLFDQAYKGNNLTQKTGVQETRKGYVEFRFFKKPEQNNGGAEPRHWRDLSLERMLEQMDELIESGYEPGDIAVLVRTGKQETAACEALMKHGKYRFVSSGSLLLSAQPSVNLILNCLRFVSGDKSPLLIAEINDYFRQLNLGEDIPFGKSKLLNDTELWTNRELVPLRNEFTLLPLGLLFHRLAGLCKLDITDPYLCRFTGILDDYSRSEGESVAGFVAWWDTHYQHRKWALELPESRDAVKIITIHKSKGLEFPVVMMPLFDWKIIPEKNQVIWCESQGTQLQQAGKLPLYARDLLNETWYQDAYQQEKLDTAFDNLNLIYVALTRPVEQLYVYANASAEQNNAGLALLSALQQMNPQPEQQQAAEALILYTGAKPVKPAKARSNQAGNIYDPLSVDAGWINPQKNSIPDFRLRRRFQSDETRMGEIIHEVLARATDSQDQEAYILRVCEKAGIQPDAKMLNAIKHTVSEAMNMLSERGWKSPAYSFLNERGICDRKGKLLRPDKVLVGENEIVIIDFKTGKNDDRHHIQVREYAEAFGEVFLKPVSAYLLYTIDMQLIKVTLNEARIAE